MKGFVTNPYLQCVLEVAECTGLPDNPEEIHLLRLQQLIWLQTAHTSGLVRAA